MKFAERILDILIFILLGVGAAFVTFDAGAIYTLNVAAQDKPTVPAKFDASETQTLRLKVKQLEFMYAQERYQAATTAFNAEIKAVEKENGWAEGDVQFHPDSLTFTAAPKPPAAAKKPAADPGAAKPGDPPAPK